MLLYKQLQFIFAERLLLPVEEIPGERLSWLRGKVDVPQADRQDLGASQVERRSGGRLPEREPLERGATAH